MLCASVVTLSGNTVLTFQGQAPTCPEGQYALTMAGDVTPSPFNLSMSEAGSVASAVLLCWAIAFSFRMLVQLLRDRMAEGSQEGEG